MQKREYRKPKRSEEMAHMERTKAEKKASAGGMAPEASGPDYPYGLRIQLDHDGMKKLGMSEMPEVGGEMHFRAKAKIIGARSEEREGSEDRHLELQITHLGMHDALEEGKGKSENGSGEDKAGKDAYYGRKRH